MDVYYVHNNDQNNLSLFLTKKCKKLWAYVALVAGLITNKCNLLVLVAYVLCKGHREHFFSSF